MEYSVRHWELSRQHLSVAPASALAALALTGTLAAGGAPDSTRMQGGAKTTRSPARAGGLCRRSTAKAASTQLQPPAESLKEASALYSDEGDLHHQHKRIPQWASACLIILMLTKKIWLLTRLARHPTRQLLGQKMNCSSTNTIRWNGEGSGMRAPSRRRRRSRSCSAWDLSDC